MAASIPTMTTPCCVTVRPCACRCTCATTRPCPRSSARSWRTRRRGLADEAAKRFGLDDGLALHKPGQRFSTDEAANDAREEARREWIDEMCNAWRKPAADASSGEFRGAQEGDVCTVREGGVGEGSPGHLRMLNGKLTCVPDKHRADAAPRSMTHGGRAKNQAIAAWLEMRARARIGVEEALNNPMHPPPYSLVQCLDRLSPRARAQIR